MSGVVARRALLVQLQARAKLAVVKNRIAIGVGVAALAAAGCSGTGAASSGSSAGSAAPLASTAPSSSSSAPTPRTRAIFGPVAEVALGGENLCVVLLDGQVQCVGEWPLQYETPTTSGAKNQYIQQPISVKDANGARALAIETNRGCGVMPDATVRCWGNTTPTANNWVGAKENELVAVEQPGIDHAKELALTWKESCALRDDGKVICWGPAPIGAGKRTGAPPPPRIRLEGVKQIGGAHMHYCALMEAGTVTCWGDARGLELTGDKVPLRDEAPQRVPLLKDVVSITVGENHNCALTTTGAVFCWGSNGAGELGVGKASPGSQPVQVPGLEAIAVEASPETPATCAIRKDGSVACWGSDFNCDIGDSHAGDCQKVVMNSTFGPSESEYCASPQTVAMDGAFKPTSLAFGSTTACAKDGGGNLRCWGRSLFGGNNACTGQAP